MRSQPPNVNLADRFKFSITFLPKKF